MSATRRLLECEEVSENNFYAMTNNTFRKLVLGHVHFTQTGQA